MISNNVILYSVDKTVSLNELKEAIFSLQINKSFGHDGISFNVLKHCFGSLHKTLLYIFNLSIRKRVFQMNRKWLE